ncbi:HAT dimerization [Penicillium samsonianum]|uniref:HAT dimerization n=1 Tax=Penicillium samsonianum TaxID=1882272 RepID=UPI0025472E2E|nr:HAT dimerization [Penicillium samsonianum]KAJ6125844.1 HAT dimerization [Penicillium samsonianum]
MILRCKSWRDIELKELPEEADKQREAQLTTNVPKAISEGEDSDENDNNENDPITLIEEEFIIESQRHPMIIVPSAGKQQRSLSVDSENETSPHLPSTTDKGGTQRLSGLRGMRKRNKPDDDDQWLRY